MSQLFLLFWIFLKVSLLTFGGGYAMVSVFYDELVTQRALMSAEEFADMVSLAQMTPGPIGLNSATYIGMQQAGVTGAVVGTLGAVTPSLILGILVAFSLKSFQESRKMKNILSGMRPATIGLVAAAVLFFAESSVFTCRLSDVVEHGVGVFGMNWIGLLIFAVAFGIGLRWKVNPVWLMLGGGLVGLGGGVVF